MSEDHTHQPPPYSYNDEKSSTYELGQISGEGAPLITPPEGISRDSLEEEESQPGQGVQANKGRKSLSRCCGLACSVMCFVGCSLLCLCCLAAVVASVVVALWFAKCSGSQNVLGRVDHFEVLFTTQGIKGVDLSNQGTLEVLRTTNQSHSLATLTQVKGKDVKAAEKVEVIQRSTEDFFTQEYVEGFWSCSTQDTILYLLDLPSLPYNLSLAAHSAGDVSMETLHFLAFESLRLESSLGSMAIAGATVNKDFEAKTATGDVRVGFITAGKSAKAKSSFGAVDVNEIRAKKVEAKSSSGSVTASSISAAEIKAETSFGTVKVSNATLLLDSKCKAEIESSSGTVTVENLILPASGGCKLDIQSDFGDVHVILIGFSGSYEIEAEMGRASLNGAACPNDKCEGKILGGAKHDLQVVSLNGNVYVTM